MRIVSDRVLAMSGPGWSYPKARVLVNDDNTAAVFTTVGPPTRLISFTSTTGRSFTTSDGATIRVRPVGSSCTWPLAKCQRSTQKMVALWVS